MKLSLGKCWGLLIFDIIGFALSGYAFLLVYQILATLPSANAFIILMAIFIGIKVVVLSLYDLNRNLLLKNIPFIGGLISLIGNGIVFGICLFLIPTVPLSFFIGLTISDFLVVTLSHFLWWRLVGEDEDVVEIASSTEERKTWLSHADEEDSEYDSIFTTLLENEKKGQQKSCEPSQPGIYEDEKRYQTSDFLKDIKQSLANKSGAESFETKVLPVTKPQPTKAAELPGTEKKPIDSTFQDVPFATEALEMESQQKKKSKGLNDLFEDLPSAERSDSIGQNVDQQAKPEPLDESLNKKVLLLEASEVEKEEDFLAIEQRLGYLFYEIEKSMEETHFLQDAVSDFHDAVETYTPIIGDEKIIATGNLIREKLKDIIDKQFVVDEVLDDLIRLSKLINNRIDDLDVIEAGLNQRKMGLDQKEVLIVENNHSLVDDDFEIMPQEVMLENLDSEFIIAEGDYESIRKYLTQTTVN